MFTVTDLEKIAGTSRFDHVVNSLIYQATGDVYVNTYDAALIAEEAGEYYLADLLYAAHGMGKDG